MCSQQEENVQGTQHVAKTNPAGSWRELTSSNEGTITRTAPSRRGASTDPSRWTASRPASGLMLSAASRGTGMSSKRRPSTPPAPGRRRPVCKVRPARPGSAAGRRLVPAQGANKIKIPQAKDQQQISPSEENSSSQWVDRIKTITREDEMLAQYCATQEKHAAVGQDAHQDQDRTGQRPAAHQLLGGGWFQPMRGQDHDLTTAQQEKYETSCWEEGVSSQWVDRIKTIASEDEGHA